MAGSNQKAQITLAWWLANCHAEILSYKRNATADIAENASTISICQIKVNFLPIFITLLTL